MQIFSVFFILCFVLDQKEALSEEKKKLMKEKDELKAQINRLMASRK